MSVNFKKVGRIGYAILDNPPVNAIGQKMRADLLAAVDWAENEELDFVILSGAGRAFAAGADAREFDAIPQPPHLPDVLNRIEACKVPWVAAIDGVALGGGAEIALACRYRIMSRASQIGFPEVTLGVIPGAGGTQRLPRLVGLKQALKLITLGRPMNATEALKIGLADRLADDPVADAARLNAVELVGRPGVSAMPPPDDDTDAFIAAEDVLAKKSRGQVAPLKALDCIRRGLGTSFDLACAAERTAFLELRSGQQAKALRHVFFAERAARAPEWLKQVRADLGSAVVVGGGTMGAGIAYALLHAGVRVTLIETDKAACARATENVQAIIQSSMKNGRIDAAFAGQISDHLVVTETYEPAAGATIAIEAAFESMDVKKEVFARLQAVMPFDAVLATNTSYLDVNEIAASVDDPSRVLGLHFFAPAYVMKLLEIVRGDETSDRALASGFALAKALKKVPVLSGVCDGFIGNRILARYREEADALLLEGALPDEIDAAMRGFGYAMGPYEAQDLSGLDIAFANRRRQDATRDPNRRYVDIADKVVGLGRLGRKTGLGWYSYANGSKTSDEIVARLISECSARHGVGRRKFEAHELQERLLLAMINEAAEILHEGIAQSPRDVDLVTIAGYGFPRWRGGLMHYADQLGTQAILEKLTELSADDPVRWRPSPLLQQYGEKGRALAESSNG